MQISKKERDSLIKHYLMKFRVCSRNQLCTLIFKNNSNPVNVCNKVMKRLSLDGTVLQVPRTKDKCYLYTANPSPIHHKSNKIAHCLKIVDAFIDCGQPEQCVIEPVLGSYEPDLFYRDHFNRSICVEVQITRISEKKMQAKVNAFVREYKASHDARLLLIYSDTEYKVKAPEGFKIIQKRTP